MPWLDLYPDDLIERYEPAEALALLRQARGLTVEQAAKLDVYLHHWTLVLLQRGNDPQGVQEMLTLCEIACDLAPAAPEGNDAKQRWSAFEDLLEGKRRYLQASQIATPIQLKHQDTILEIIEQAHGRRVRQLDFVEVLKLSPGRVSQILGVLESRSLITRQRLGKESWVSLAEAASTTPKREPAVTRSKEHLGARVFSFRKAA